MAELLLGEGWGSEKDMGWDVGEMKINSKRLATKR